MSKKNLTIGLLAVVVFQLLVLAAEYGNAVYPLWTGQEVRLKTVPIDPRSLFRGNYARLRYEISEIPGADINKERTPRNGEVIYVGLKAGEDGVCSYSGASLERPEDGMYIRGRIQTWRPHRSETYQVEYGIEAFFAPKEKALKLEKNLRSQGIAKVMLARNGKAALKDVVGEEDLQRPAGKG